MHRVWRDMTDLFGSTKHGIGSNQEKEVENEADKDVEKVIGKGTINSHTFIDGFSGQGTFICSTNGNGNRILGARNSTTGIFIHHESTIAVPTKGNITGPFDSPMHIG
mmetsp:Transcript_36566/g.72744  ORF Transcript_36566/g.72744 Transcript_36566/m.72744 type:complete len:108 (+) Transcript_36566:53-376(+)